MTANTVKTGIGTTSPSDSLTVNGSLTADSMTVSGTVTATGFAGNGSGLTGIFPSGVIFPYAGASTPNGWLLCDGSQVSRATYADLFSAIDTAWGNGDGSTTFHLPDLRGRFIRGVDNGAGNDPDTSTRTASNSGGNTGDTIGSVQGDTLASHRHHISNRNNVGSTDNVAGVTNWFANATVTTYTDYEGGNETRPKNAYVNYIIKY